MRGRVAISLLVSLCAPLPAGAHGMRSLYVEIADVSFDSARVTVRAQVPVTGVRLSVAPPCNLVSANGNGEDA